MVLSFKKSRNRLGVAACESGAGDKAGPQKQPALEGAHSIALKMCPIKSYSPH